MKKKLLRRTAAILLAGAMLTGTATAEWTATTADEKNHVIQQICDEVAVASVGNNFDNEIRTYIDSILPQHLAGLYFYGSMVDKHCEQTFGND